MRAALDVTLEEWELNQAGLLVLRRDDAARSAAARRQT